MKKPTKENEVKPNETVAALKNETHEKNAVKKGYNEKNPAQPQGAFKPDSLK